MQLRKAGWGEGADVYFHTDLYIDPATTIVGNFSNPWRAIFTWPTTQNGNCSTGGFGLEAMDSNGNVSPSGTPSITMSGDSGVCGANNTNFWRLNNPVKGAWYSFIVHRVFSYNPAIGLFEFWMRRPGETAYTKQTFNDGSQVMHQRTIGCSGCSDNMRVGLYRNPLFTTTDVLYYGNIRAVTTFAAAQ